jgi:uncharacterized protein (DUF983 family)
MIGALMNVTQRTILSRGMKVCCPNCGGRTLFEPGKPLTLRRVCPSCGLKLADSEGFFLGAMSLNYAMTLVGFHVPVALMWYSGILGGRLAVALAAIGALVLPVLLYRPSRSWQLMVYYFFLPHQLPANRGRPKGSDDENV